MSSISLEASIRTCKVDQGWASRVESDRFLNPDLMICPTWNGVDNMGRFVHPDSFYTKNAGCQSAEDRVLVENALRPQYAEYVTLDARGLEGAWNGQVNYAGMLSSCGAQKEQNAIDNLNYITGHNGVGYRSVIQASCNPSASVYADQDMMRAQNAQPRQPMMPAGMYPVVGRDGAGLPPHTVALHHAGQVVPHHLQPKNAVLPNMHHNIYDARGGQNIKMHQANGMQAGMMARNQMAHSGMM